MTGSTRRRVSTALLVAGYPIAAVGGRRIVPAIRDRRAPEFYAFETGTAMVVVGLLLRGRRVLAGLNAATLAGTAVAWRNQGRGSTS